MTHAYMWDITHLYAMCFIHICGMPRSYRWAMSYRWGMTLLIYMWDMTRVYMSDMTYLYVIWLVYIVRRDSFVFVRHGSFIFVRHDSFICKIWLIYINEVWRYSSTRETWLMTFMTFHSSCHEILSSWHTSLHDIHDIPFFMSCVSHM